MMPRPSQGTLTEVPIELQLYILEYLEPLDVLQCRRTCKALCDVSRERLLWISLLRRLMQRNSVFEPSYDIPNMTLLQLEYAATSPYRWLRLAQGTDDQSQEHEPVSQPLRRLQPRRVTLLQHPTPPSDAFPSLWEGVSIHLVLGGRYLIAGSFDWLALWDLDLVCISGEEHRKAMPIAVARAGFNMFFLVNRTPDGQGLRIYLAFDGGFDDYDAIRLSIYDVYPQHQQPMFAQVAEHLVQSEDDLGNVIGSTIMVADYACFLRGSILNIWNFTANKFCCISIEVETGTEQPMFIANNAVCVVFRDCVKVWSIPQSDYFTQNLALHPGTAVTIPPQLIIPIPSLFSPDQIIDIEVFDTWYSGTIKRHFFSQIVHRASESRHFELSVNGDLREGRIDAGDSEYVRNGRQYMRFPPLLCNDNRVDYRSSILEGSVELEVTPLFQGGSQEYLEKGKVGKSPPHISTLYEVTDPSEEVESEFGLCPFSGRFVRFGYGRIEIYDYISGLASNAVKYSDRSDTMLEFPEVEATQLPLDTDQRLAILSS